MPSTISAGTTGGTAIAFAGDTSGELQLRTNGTTPAVTISTAQNATFAGSINSNNTFGFKNRIINGAMVIDQRNAGASVTVPNDSNFYTVDRWQVVESSSCVLSAQQVTDAPSGFNNSLKLTVTTAAGSIGVSETGFLLQRIEGFNTADLSFGTANASTVTVSFWVKSSITGNFSGSLKNAAGNRSYPFSYTINAANTWEQKSVTIAGDTSGTWVGATNGVGVGVTFNIGSGSNRLGTAGAWAASNFDGATSSAQIVTTLNATFQITGVQFEKGTQATSFEYRQYTTELQLAQRYYEPSYTWVIAAYNNTGLTTGNANPSFLVQKRTTATMTLYPQTAGGTQGAFPSTTGFLYFDNTNATKQLGSSSDTIAWVASAEL
jgi:hypothetical protein